MSPAEYAGLRANFGISAFEADHVLPAWEVDALLSTINEQEG